METLVCPYCGKVTMIPCYFTTNSEILEFLYCPKCKSSYEPYFRSKGYKTVALNMGEYARKTLVHLTIDPKLTLQNYDILYRIHGTPYDCYAGFFIWH